MMKGSDRIQRGLQYIQSVLALAKEDKTDTALAFTQHMMTHPNPQEVADDMTILMTVVSLCNVAAQRAVEYKEGRIGEEVAASERTRKHIDCPKDGADFVLLVLKAVRPLILADKMDEANQLMRQMVANHPSNVDHTLDALDAMTTILRGMSVERMAMSELFTDKPPIVMTAKPGGGGNSRMN